MPLPCRPGARSHVHIGLLQGEGGLLISTSKTPSEDALSHPGSAFGMQEGGPRDSGGRWLLMIATEWKGAFHNHASTNDIVHGGGGARTVVHNIPSCLKHHWRLGTLTSARGGVGAEDTMIYGDTLSVLIAQRPSPLPSFL